SKSRGKPRHRPRRRRRAASGKASRRSARSGRPASAGAEEREHLAVVRPTSLCLLREDELAVRHYVVLALGALAGGRLESFLTQLGRETRGPFVIAASDGAVEDLDGHAKIVRRGWEPTARASFVSSDRLERPGLVRLATGAGFRPRFRPSRYRKIR